MREQYFASFGQDNVADLKFDHESIGVYTPIEVIYDRLVRNIGLDMYTVEPHTTPVEISLWTYYCPSYSIGEKLNWNIEVCKKYLNITTNSFRKLVSKLDKKSNIVPINRRRILDYIKINYKADNIHPAEVRAYLHALRYTLAYYESLQCISEENRKEVFDKRILVYENWQEQKLRELLEVA
jgi:CRISPR/Cas system CSM-associated protein Csm2 small subunit